MVLNAESEVSAGSSHVIISGYYKVKSSSSVNVSVFSSSVSCVTKPFLSHTQVFVSTVVVRGPTLPVSLTLWFTSRRQFFSSCSFQADGVSIWRCQSALILIPWRCDWKRQTHCSQKSKNGILNMSEADVIFPYAFLFLHSKTVKTEMFSLSSTIPPAKRSCWGIYILLRVTVWWRNT